MNLLFLSKTDKELHAIRDQQDADGKLARKEITRSFKCGYSDGTAIEVVGAKAEVETESRVGTVTIISGGAR
jgi:hypothetical protein